MTDDQRLRAALSRLEKVCGMRPELRPLAQINTQLLQTLFPANSVNQTEQVQTTDAIRLSERIPVLRSAPPILNEAILRSHWLNVCKILSSNESHASAVPLAIAVATGSFRVVEQLGAVLSGSPERCRDELHNLGLDVSLGFTVLRLSSLPVLATIAQRLEPHLVPGEWDQGDCPICGNWPLLAELRGLEQLRWLRCGWCASQWQMDRLHCPFCGNRDHRQLRDVVVDGQEDAYRLSVCDACGESLPTLATLMPLSPPALLVAEMETLHLRMVAATRQGARP